MTGTNLKVFKGEWGTMAVPAGPVVVSAGPDGSSCYMMDSGIFPSAVGSVWASFSSLGVLVALSSPGLTLSSKNTVPSAELGLLGFAEAPCSLKLVGGWAVFDLRFSLCERWV